MGTRRGVRAGPARLRRFHAPPHIRTTPCISPEHLSRQTHLLERGFGLQQASACLGRARCRKRVAPLGRCHEKRGHRRGPARAGVPGDRAGRSRRGGRRRSVSVPAAPAAAPPAAAAAGPGRRPLPLPPRPLLGHAQKHVGRAPLSKQAGSVGRRKRRGQAAGRGVVGPAAAIASRHRRTRGIVGPMAGRMGMGRWAVGGGRCRDWAGITRGPPGAHPSSPHSPAPCRPHPLLRDRRLRRGVVQVGVQQRAAHHCPPRHTPAGGRPLGGGWAGLGVTPASAPGLSGARGGRTVCARCPGGQRAKTGAARPPVQSRPTARPAARRLRARARLGPNV